MRNFLILTMLLLVGVSCTKIEELSSKASINSYSVLSHSPQTIIVGEARMSADSIYIPIEYGKYEFPLNLKVKVGVTAGAHIYGLDSNEEITFESIDAAAHRFVVSAESGAAKNYYIALEELPLGESVDIYNKVSFCGDEDKHLFLSNQLFNGESEDSKFIVAVDAAYPLVVTPRFSVDESTTINSYRIAESGEWSSFENGVTPLEFEEQTQIYELEVIAESGKRFVWRVGAEIIESSAIDPTMQIDYRELSATIEQLGINVERFDIDFESGEITIVIDEEETEAEFPLALSLNIPINEWLTLLGVPDSYRYTFNSWEERFPFVLLYAEKHQATRWSVAIAKSEPKAAQIEVESAAVSKFSTGTYKFIFTFNHLTQSTQRVEPSVYAKSREIHLYYSSYYMPALASSEIPNWWAEYDLALTLDNGEQINRVVRWEAAKNKNDKVTQSEIKAAVASTQRIEVEQPDGTVEEWSVKLIKDNVEISSECDLLGIEVVNTLPNYLDFEDPAYLIEEGAQTLYFNIGEHYNFPMRIDINCEVSSYASVEPESLYFESELSEQKITVLAQDGVTSKEYIVKLIVPQAVDAPAITSIEFGELAAGATLIGDVEIDAENHNIVVAVEATSAQFPLSLPIVSVEVADGGNLEMPSSGALVFASSSDLPKVWVSSADGTARQLWSVELFYYEQIAGGDMNSWEFDASPITSSKPWSTPNMSGIAAVKNTNPVTGYSGAEGDYAAEMQTGTSWGQLAAGSIFTGWFDKGNSTSLGLSDPVRLTHFGIPFSADAKIKGVSVQLSYAQAANAVDWGSLTVILIDADSDQAFEFHGNKPNDYKDPTKGSAPHPMNSATQVAIAKKIFGNGSASQTAYGDTIDQNLVEGEWIEIFIPISTDQPFSHISIAAASSAYGDYFIGQKGSVMRLDNVKIVY